MSKKSTTGGPRARRLSEADIQRRAQYKSRAERERERQRIALYILGGFVAFSAVLLVLAIVSQTLIVPASTITEVNGDEIKVRDFRERVRFERYMAALQVRNIYFLSGGDVNTVQQYAGTELSQLQRPELMGASILEMMEEELILEQGARDLGVVIDDEMVDAQIERYMSSSTGVSLPPTGEETPTPVPSITLTPLVSPTPSPTATNTPTATPEAEEDADAEGAADADGEGDADADAQAEDADAEADAEADADADAQAEDAQAEDEGVEDTDAETADAEAADADADADAQAEAADAEAADAEAADADAEGDGEGEATPTETPTLTPTLSNPEIFATIDQAANEFFDDAMSTADVDRDVVRDLFYYAALRIAMEDEIGKEVPTSELQVDARHILISFNPDQQQSGVPPTDEERAAALARAERVMQSLQEGEPFAAVARAVSDDAGSGARGGALGWASPENYVANFRDTVSEAELGTIVGPIETEFGYHIIQVQGREVRDLGENELTQRRQQAFDSWLTEQRALANIDRDGDWIDRVPDQPTYNELLGDILPIN